MNQILRRHVKLAPAFLLVLLAIATAIEVGCANAEDDESTSGENAEGYGDRH